MKKATRREDFKVCPICGGKFHHGDNQSECLQCFFVLMNDCCYTLKGKKVLKDRKKSNDWYRENCKLDLYKSECPKLTKTDYFECEYCPNHLLNVSPKVFAFQCSSCGYRVLVGDAKTQNSSCESCNKGIMMSKDLDNTMFQDPIVQKEVRL